MNAHLLESIDTPSPYRNQAAQRVMTVLSAFQTAPSGWGLSDLARTLSMSKNMVHRALATLIDAGYVVRAPDERRYCLGPRVLTLSAGDAGEIDVATLSRPYLARLHQITGESIYLSIIVGQARVTIDEILAPGPRVLRSHLGAPVPLHCTKMSRVLLAQLPDAEINAYLAAASPLHRPMAFRDPPSETAEGVWDDIGALRGPDPVLWRNPHRSSAAYAIFPLLDANKRPHGIVTVGGPSERFDPRSGNTVASLLAALEPLKRQLAGITAPIFEAAP